MTSASGATRAHRSTGRLTTPRDAVATLLHAANSQLPTNVLRSSPNVVHQSVLGIYRRCGGCTGRNVDVASAVSVICFSSFAGRDQS